MKKIRMIVLTVIICILLFPKTDYIKDGGSVRYHSFLYDIYQMHRIDPGSPSGYIDGVCISILGWTVYDTIPPEIEK